MACICDSRCTSIDQLCYRVSLKDKRWSFPWRTVLQLSGELWHSGIGFQEDRSGFLATSCPGLPVREGVVWVFTQHLAGWLAHAETVCRACTDAADPRRCFDQAQQDSIFALNNCPEGARHCGLTENKMQQTGLFPFGQYFLPYLPHPGWGLLAFPGKKDVKKRNQKAASGVWAQIPKKHSV